ncbi:hypothetical protein, partial [Flavonifractor plautii]|uniref:hypothetical protein n=1 Tax=Flavonifractor plautii TaxID=292800 RepID=UPI003D7CE3C9
MLWKQKILFFGLPQENTTRNQWLSCIYNTFPEWSNPNIQMCAVHFMKHCFLILGENDYNAGASDSQ